MLYDGSSGGGSVILGFLLIILVLLVALYVFYSYCLYKIAVKTNTKLEWLAFIPFVNFAYPFYIAKFPWWLIAICVLALFAPNEYKIIYLISLIGYAYAWSKIAQQLNRPSWWGIPLIISPINLIFMWFLAFRSSPQAVPSEQVVNQINN